MGEGVDEIAVGVLGQALQGHRAAGRNCTRYFAIALPVAQSPVENALAR
jgi:hypothetical protein